MAAILRLTPLGVGCLLEVDDIGILLECGWNEDFSEEALEPLKSLAHCGALPFVMGRLGMACPVYATLPVHRMGKMFLQDIYKTRVEEVRESYAYVTLLQEEFNMWTMTHVEDAFRSITQLKYSQPVHLTGKGSGVKITPYPAGYMIGGAIWKITKETEEIVYGINYNHKNERHLKRSMLHEKELQRPNIFITNARLTGLPKPSRRSERDKQLFQTIVATLRRGGNVLLPVDSAGRVLEVLLMLDAYWKDHRELSGYPLVWLSHVGHLVTQMAAGQTEWMHEKISKIVQSTRSNPFDLTNVKTCRSVAQVDSLPQPRVVLAGPISMDYGFSRQVFASMADNPKNTVIITHRTLKEASLAEQLLAPTGPPRRLELEMKARVPLVGAELDRYRHERALREADAAREDLLLDGSDSEEMESEEEGGSVPMSGLTTEGGTGMGISFFRHGHDEYVPRGIHSYALHAGAGVCPVFPPPRRRHNVDLYGQVINPEEYRKGVQGMEEMGGDQAQPMEEGNDQVVDPKQSEEIPRKEVSSRVVVSIRCEIHYINFEGLTDGVSIRRVIAEVKPTKLLLVHGVDAQKTEVLRKYCCANAICKEAQAPLVGQPADITGDASVYKVRLDDSLMHRLHMAKAGEYEVAFVDGTIRMEDGVAVLAHPNEEQPAREPISVGDVSAGWGKLSQVRKLLQKEGFQAEFAGGMLVVGGFLSLRSQKQYDGTVTIAMEGSLCDDYWRVRDILYQEHAVL